MGRVLLPKFGHNYCYWPICEGRKGPWWSGCPYTQNGLITEVILQYQLQEWRACDNRGQSPRSPHS